ncbi:TIGR01212 family radical SAM protein [Serpentinicella alkaliphila]|uniref:Radical SAM core domain-containing protein n=1 Tax=Serpentinicella alkaliphila TaxID=1734049 RepID=A0A4R2TCR5_9FIRM|nr:TIGR01212 family radical SAM protein [Serpentinicella alkaliphila]QUH25782.1 TIGR01212 family radical SAM protein [Serpentinicella alkaliphila]TCP99781.1 hypothetical protein EDD79_103325 [Serpentinicella alkaliphila]
MEDKELYKTYSKYLVDKYGDKVYKLPVNLPLTCPNRDGTIGIGGCTFCADVGAGFESLCNTISVRDQLIKNKEYISKKYKAKKFIAYFQNYTNTYLPIDEFKKYVLESIIDDVVEIAISTRPDFIEEEYLQFLKEVEINKGVSISMELGLQTVNYHTLKKVNRGHGLSEFIDAVLRIKKYGFNICVHLILNLPWDNMDDVLENARILSVLDIDQVKLHALYIINGTVMGDMHQNHEFTMIPVEEYMERVIVFLENIHPEIVVQRLIGRAPEENSLFVNWNMSWWKIRDEIHEIMHQRGSYQGKNYLFKNNK